MTNRDRRGTTRRHPQDQRGHRRRADRPSRPGGSSWIDAIHRRDERHGDAVDGAGAPQRLVTAIHALVVVACAALVLAACSASTTKTAAPTTTVSSSSTTVATTVVPTTQSAKTSRGPTTSAAPAASKPPLPTTAQGYAQALFAAWKANDRAAASLVASPQAVEAIFARPFPQLPTNQGLQDLYYFDHCSGAAGSTICVFGGQDAELDMRVRNTAAGVAMAVVDVTFKLGSP